MSCGVPASQHRPLRVASVPAAHPYVTSLGLAAAGVITLPDPPVSGAPPGQWWPPVMLDSDWITAHAAAFDLLHIHFGYESLSLTELTAAVRALRAQDRPLVLTVHDLENPQLQDQTHHQRQLALLLGHAEAVITLTPGAQTEIRRRWGRDAAVIPHPHLFPLTAPFPVAPEHPELHIGVPLRDLRPNIDAVAVTRAVISTGRLLRATGTECRVSVTVHPRVRDEAARAEIRALCQTSDGVRLSERDRPDDATLTGFLATLDLCVLPYRHGTHSGWLELCWELGVPVAGPRHGHFAAQHDDAGFYLTRDITDGPALADALRARPPSPRAGSSARLFVCERRRAERLARRPEITAAHLAVYRSALLAARDQR